MHAARPALRLAMALVLALSWAAPPCGAAATPIKSLRISRTYGWSPRSADTLILWIGIEEPYLVAVMDGCPDLTRVGPGAISTHRRRLTVGADVVLAGGAACRIRSIQPADAHRLGDAAAGASRRPPLPVIHKD